MRVAVFGAGALGAFYGARFSEGGADVALIARGAHLAALRDMAETWAVGRASDVALADDLVERQFALLDGHGWEATTSLAHDRAIGHRMELEALQGTVRRLGRELGVPTPAIEAVHAVIEPWALRNALPPV